MKTIRFQTFLKPRGIKPKEIKDNERVPPLVQVSHLYLMPTIKIVTTAKKQISIYTCAKWKFGRIKAGRSVKKMSCRHF